MTQTSCQRCGTCCRKGGPVLHQEDLEILTSGQIPREHLITIRKGEQVFSPVNGAIELASREMLKIRGQGGTWTCLYHSEAEKSCRIYRNRPLECRLLQCWDTQALEAVIGRQVLGRQDLLPPQDPLRRVIEIHDRHCACELLLALGAGLGRGRDQEILAELTDLIRRDCLIRLVALKELKLEERLDLFVFGRPLFKQLAPHGIRVFEQQGELCLALDETLAQ